MSRADWIALLLSLLAAAAAALVSQAVFENMAHVEDEFAYLWQAQVMARGDLTRPSPDHPKSFLIPFVIDHEGQRFGKYPLGWPAALSLGVRFQARAWVNPILAGFTVWLLYRLGTQYFSRGVSLLAAFLLVSSPFFLMNAGSLLSHAWSLFLSTAFTLSWVDGFRDGPGEASRMAWLKTVTAGAALGTLGLTRPLTMVGISLPFALHGIYLLISGNSSQRKRVLLVGGVALLLLSLHLVWQYAATGSYFQNPYTLWWPYDKYGFGPGYGVTEGGHSLHLAWKNTRHSLRAGISDLFGWGTLSWLFLPLGLWVVIRRKEIGLWLISLLPLVLILLYAGYWVGSWLLGPRYYFEAFPAYTLLTAAGIAWLAGWPLQAGQEWTPFSGWKKIRPLGVTALVGLLFAANLTVYLPLRLGGMHGLYTIERADLAPFTRDETQELTPALVIVHPRRWMSYGSLLELTTPYFDTPFFFAWSRGTQSDAALAADYQDTRAVFHYYPDSDPTTLYTAPRPTDSEW
jgi:hypothetical protein